MEKRHAPILPIFIVTSHVHLDAWSTLSAVNNTTLMHASRIIELHPSTVPIFIVVGFL